MVVEGSFVSARGKGYVRQLGIHDDSLVSGLRLLASAIHESGSKAFIQIQHCGRRTSSKVTGMRCISASSVPAYEGAEVPEEMDEEMIEQAISEFVAAALRAKRAGFDGVDIHAAHGYLPGAFLARGSNLRKDKWGGSLENRARFLTEIVRRIKLAAGPDFPVTVKISAEEFVVGGLELAESMEIAGMLEQAGADAITASAGAPGTPKARDLTKAHEFLRTLPMGTAPGCLLHIAESLKRSVSIPVIAVGKLADPAVAARAVAEDKADLVAIARGLLADPDWPEKVRQGRISEIRRCISCNHGCYDRILAQQDVACAINPEAGREHELGLLPQTPAGARKKVLVVGGGPAGLEAAITAKRRGHDVVLAEQGSELGGQLNIARVPPDRGEIGLFLDYLKGEAVRTGVDVRLRQPVDAEFLREQAPDVVIVTSGARPAALNLEVDANGIPVISAWGVLCGAMPPGPMVAVVGAGLVGCETADYLSRLGYSVVVIEMLGDMALDASGDERTLLREKFRELGVELVVNSTVKRVEREGVTVHGPEGDRFVKANAVVVAVGSQPERPYLFPWAPGGRGELDLKGKAMAVHYAGDSVRPRKIMDAVHEGFRVAIEL